MEVTAYKKMVEELREQWRRLWRERIEDRVRAEGIADKDFSSLFVDKGTVITATRNFKQLRLREILQLHKLQELDKFAPPSPDVGGWGKFIRTVVVTKRASFRVEETRRHLDDRKLRQQLKKGGRGWLHA